MLWYKLGYRLGYGLGFWLEYVPGFWLRYGLKLICYARVHCRALVLGPLQRLLTLATDVPYAYCSWTTFFQLNVKFIASRC